MASSELGKSIRSAARSLLAIQRDIRELFNSLQSGFQYGGWSLARESHWKDDAILIDRYALFTQGGKAAGMAILVALDLDAPAILDEPYLLTAVAWFRQIVEPSSVWNEWGGDDCARVLRLVVDAPNPVELAETVRQPYFVPTAKRAVAFAVPLAALSSAEELKRLVIDPALLLTGPSPR